MTYFDMIVWGAVITAVGLTLRWRTDEFSGRRFLGKLCLLAGYVLIMWWPLNYALAYLRIP